MDKRIEFKRGSSTINMNNLLMSLVSMAEARQGSEEIKTKKSSEGLTIETELEEENGRWIAEVVELSGVLVYGQTEKDAINKAKSLALRVLADRLEHGEAAPGLERLFRLSSTSSSKISAK